MKRVFTKQYLPWFILIFISYIFLAILLSQFYLNFKYMPYYISTIKWSWFLTSVVFTLIIGFLVALNSIYAYVKYKEHKEFKKETALSCVGTIGGLSTGVCPSCVAGLFPLILDGFGISFSYAALPFKGLEVQFLVIVILGISLYFLHRRI